MSGTRADVGAALRELDSAKRELEGNAKNDKVTLAEARERYLAAADNVVKQWRAFQETGERLGHLVE